MDVKAVDREVLTRMPVIFSYVVMARATWMNCVKRSMDTHRSWRDAQMARKSEYESALMYLQTDGPKIAQVSEAEGVICSKSETIG